MNGTARAAAGLARAVVDGCPAFGFRLGVEVAVFPPFPYLAAVAGILAGTPVTLGAQDVSRYAPGARTGEVAAGMLRDVGCRWAIVGHSERRTLLGETDGTVRAKADAAAQSGLVPIACVGETLDRREGGRSGAGGRPAGRRPARGRRSGCARSAGDRLRAGMGHRDRPERHPGTGPGDAPVRYASGSRAEATRRPGRCGSSTAAASASGTRPSCSRCPTSTAGWSGAHPSTRPGSPRSAGRPPLERRGGGRPRDTNRT